MIHIVKVDMGFFEHWALVSDRTFKGKPMLISNTARRGSVYEEPWDDVVKGRRYTVVPFKTTEHASAVLSRARRAIGKVKYSLPDYNCEHFVWHVITGEIKSTQLRNLALMGGILILSQIFKPARIKPIA